MNEIDDGFTKLLGRQPTDKEKQDLYRVSSALNLKNNDALWLVIMALQHYQSQYERFPEAIAKAAKDVLVNFKTTADAEVKASVEAAKANLSQAVAATAREVAHNTSKKQLWKWETVCFVVALLLLSGAFAAGHYLAVEKFEPAKKAGYAEGYENGINKANAEMKKLEAFTQSRAGELLIQMQRVAPSYLEMIVRCNNKDWTTSTDKKGIKWCFHKTGATGAGWPLMPEYDR
jgi:hypothetical protein